MILQADVESYVTGHAGLTTLQIALALQISPRWARACLVNLQALGRVVQTLPAGTWAHT